MENRTTIYPFILAIVMLCPVVINAQQKGSFVSNGRNIDNSSFDEAIRHMIDSSGIPALSLAIIDNNKIVFCNNYGYKGTKNMGKVDRKTVFEACSLSKIFLVYVVQKLVQEGRLDLNRPMYQYLEYPALAHDDRYKLITPKMIISHTSGIENWAWHHTKEKLEIISTPGEAYTYSGEGFIYLARVIESILQVPYESYISSMVLTPLGLEDTYLKFVPAGINPLKQESPSDYAIGHNSLGRELDKWKSPVPIPSTSIHTTARDFSALILSMFDGKHFPDTIKRAMLQPVISVEDNPFIYMCSGFSLLLNAQDTIVMYNGSNEGFKAKLFYSVVNKRGFVFFTNSDRGGLIVEKLAALSGCGLDLRPEFADSVHEQYPSAAFSLLKTYREGGQGKMFRSIDELGHKEKLKVNTLNELGDLFLDDDMEISKKLLLKNINLFPTSALSYFLLGTVYFETNGYDSAAACFIRARELNYDPEETEAYIRECNEGKKDLERRSPLLSVISSAEATTIQAENYNLMRGVRLEVTADIDGGQNVNRIDTGDWLRYRIQVSRAGNYSIAFRLGSLFGGRQIQLRSGAALLGTIEVPATGGWQTWKTLTMNVHLPAGLQTVELYADIGGFNLNWLKVSYNN